tara:strand:- start:79 stop:279 length:201 start_codon:yes stop_codon:yes gene_type:complete
MNMTRKPHIKNNRVLKINPTSAETVVSAYPALVKLINIINEINAADINLIILVIRPPFNRMTYKFN